MTDTRTTTANNGTPAPEFTVLIPTLNEELRVSDVVRQAFAAGARQVLVADSDSADSTAQRANDAGADVVQVSSLPPHTTAIGKGDAVARAARLISLPYTVILDGDLTIDGPAFIRSLLAPLADQAVKLSKASFERVRPHPAAPESGRVTELTARPLLSIYYPDLAGLREPLSGQVAVPTSLFDQIELEPDYGLEVGMLIDVYERFGADSIAHPDCGSLNHLSQTDSALVHMANQVSRAILSRALGPGPHSEL